MADPNEYPKAKYHAQSDPRLVLNEEEEAALGPEWFDYPDLRNRPKPPKAQEKPAEKPKKSKETVS